MYVLHSLPVQANMLATILLALIYQDVSLAGLPPGRCSVENQACEVREDNVIDTIGGVNLQECEAMCSNTIGFKFITFGGQ